MRIHTNTLTATDVYVAAHGAAYGTAPLTGGIPGVQADVMAHGSRTHLRALEVRLTGTSGHRPNGHNHGPNDYAATWDQWGIFLARLFAVDPGAVVGSVGRPTYAGAEHFHWVTGDRYRTLTPEQQHKRHRWTYTGLAATGAYSVLECADGKSPCGAILRRASLDYVREHFGAALAGVR